MAEANRTTRNSFWTTTVTEVISRLYKDLNVTWQKTKPRSQISSTGDGSAIMLKQSTSYTPNWIVPDGESLTVVPSVVVKIDCKPLWKLRVYVKFCPVIRAHRGFYTSIILFQPFFSTMFFFIFPRECAQAEHDDEWCDRLTIETRIETMEKGADGQWSRISKILCCWNRVWNGVPSHGVQIFRRQGADSSGVWAFKFWNFTKIYRSGVRTNFCPFLEILLTLSEILICNLS